MLNYDLCLVNLCDPKVRSEIHRRKLKSGCFLLLLGRIWELRSNGWKGLKEILVLLSESFYKEESSYKQDLLLIVLEYLESMGMSEHKWKELEEELVSEGVFKKGGIMNIREAILQRGIQKGIHEGMQKGRVEGLQEGRAEMVLNMLKKNAEISFISDVTGLSQDEIKKLKNGSKS